MRPRPRPPCHAAERLLFFTVALAAALATLPAQAACPNSASTCNSVCSLSGTTLTCATNVNGHGSASNVWAVYDPSGSSICGAAYCVWGNDNQSAPVDFCCTLTPGPGLSALDIEIFTDSQTATNDVVRLRYFNGSSYELTDNGSIPVTALASTGAADDTIEGSNSASADYSETLDGGDGNDDVTANGGDDFVLAGDGADTCDGGSGIDDIQGEAGPDEIHAGAGADVVDGGDDGDIIYGSYGADNASGGGGLDDVCGQEDGDLLYGNADNDDMWGEGGTDGGDGGAGVDQCELFGDTYTSCVASLTSSPCP